MSEGAGDRTISFQKFRSIYVIVIGHVEVAR